MDKSTFEKNGKAWSDEDAKSWFDSYCESNGVKIPKTFADFYSRYNGFRIRDEDLEFVFELPEAFWQREDLRFSGFFSAEDTFLNFSDREGVSFPTGTIPFVDIELASICISVRGDSFGQIFFCEQDPMPDQMPESSFEAALEKFNPGAGKIPGIVLKIAENFEDFIARVRMEEW